MGEASDPTSTREDVGVGPRGPSDLPDQLLRGRLYQRLFPSVPPPSTRLGRFVLLRELGRGGMGVVLSAYDEQLDRKVAIKLLHADVSRNEEARARLLREAQALARLSHPNVVQVHEAGVHEGQVYLVMEYVEGRTLRHWLEDDAPRGKGRWRAVLEPLLAAGEGLAAAHEAGLTHRDFKPDNVLVGDDGRVRVADFGLATEGAVGSTNDGVPSQSETTEEGASPRTADGAEGPTPRPLERVTRTGLAVGTVAYMPLEQLRGETADARSDQFSFCVTLFEALFGVRPFEGKTRASIMVALEEGRRVRVDVGSVPRGLRRAIEQGLATDPELRQGDMRALLLGLRRPLRQRRLGMASAAALAVVSALGGAAAFGSSQGPAPCEGMNEMDVPGWGAERRASVESAWQESVVPHARATWPYVQQGLDAHAAAWRALRLEACEATHVQRVASPGDERRTNACLDRYGRQLDALTGRLGEAKAIASASTPDAVDSLPDPADCRRDRALLRGPLPSEAEQADVVAVEESIARSIALGETGSPREALEIAETATERARSLEHVPTRVEALRVRGTLCRVLGRLEPAERDLVDALTLAESVGADQLAFDVLLELVALAMDRSLRRSGRSWAALARGKLSRTGGDDARRTMLTMQEGLVAYAERDYEAAIESLREGLSDLLEHDGPLLTIASAHNNLANALEGAGRWSDAERQRTLALERLEPLVGMHPRVGHLRFNLGAQQLAEGRTDEADANLERALEIFEAHGNDLRVADAHVALAQSARAASRAEAAAAHARRAARAADAHRDDHTLWSTLESLNATLAQDRGDFESAITGYRLAIEHVEQQEQPDPVLTVAYGINIGECELMLGRLDEAQKRFEAALAAELPEDWRPLPQWGLGEIHRRRGSTPEAIDLLERAREDRQRFPTDPRNLAEIQWSLARAYAAAGRPDAEVDEIARLALAGFESLGPSAQERVAQLTRWRRRRSTSPPTVSP